MPPKRKEVNCLQCKEKVTEKQYSVSCSICDRWLHKDCGLDDDEYKLINKIFTKNGYHFWTCEGCSLGLKKIQKMVANNEREISSLREDVNKLTTDSTKQQTDLKATNDKLEVLTSDVDNLKKTAGKGDGNNEQVFSELDLREAKKTNLVIFNVPEPDTHLTVTEKKKKDESTVINIFKDVDQIVEMKSEIKFLARLGELKDANKCRPITVGFRDAEMKDKILNSAWKLSKSKTFSKISLTPDLTKMQISKENDLFNQAKQKNDELSNEDAKNYVWKLVGPRGFRQLRKVKKKQQTQEEDPRQRTGSVRRTREEMEGEEVVMDTSQQSKRQC